MATNNNKTMITLTPERMKYLTEKKSCFDEFNGKLAKMRKTQIYNSLKESTKVRNDILMKIKQWIEALETRLFDPKHLDEMNSGQLIELFKYVGEYSIKFFAQLGDLEILLKSYTESVDSIAKMEQSGNTNKDEVNSMKKELLKAFFDSLQKNAEEAVIQPMDESMEDDGDAIDVTEIDDKIPPLE
jgi:Glu-tRNA(Gln) amidotransferase subunit E-like FAD-binding protein